MYQIQTAGATLLITHITSLSTAEAAAKKAGLSSDKIIVLESRGNTNERHSYPTIEKLVQEGLERPPSFVERKLDDDEGTKKIAYLCFSSGTTGRPKVHIVSPAKRSCLISEPGSCDTSLFSDIKRHSICCLQSCGRSNDPLRETAL